MSIFAKVKEITEDPNTLNERFQHLQKYAELLGVENSHELAIKCGIAEGLTKLKLDDFQIAIESAKSQTEMRSEQKEPFVINSKERADWYFKVSGALVHEIDGMKAQLKLVEAQLKSFDALFKQQTEDWGLTEYAFSGVKTTILPHGTIRIRTQKEDSYSVEDEGELQNWLGNLSVEDRALFKVFAKTYTRDLELIKANTAKGLIDPPGLKKSEAGNKISLTYPKQKEE